MRRVLKNSDARTTEFSSWAMPVLGDSLSSFDIDSLSDGHFLTAKHIGTTLSGASPASPLTTYMRLSPPIPDVEISAAITLVLVPPMVAPSGSSLGLPFLIIPISVVVPPMSMTIASLTPVRHMAPIRLAAGPDIIVSTGLRLASASLIMEPSPRTIMRGACMLYSASTVFMERMRSSMTGSRRAFIMHVTALSLNPRPDDRSCPQTAGMPRILSTMPLTRSSCSGFLTDR